MSLAMISAAAAIVVGATSAYFNDTETSTGNTFTAGTIDIAVDGENPWTKSWENYLDKPCQTNYMTFTVKNAGENPANLWKRINNVATGGGDNEYCGASSEPEYVEGGGLFEGNQCITGPNNGYTERDDLDSYMVYDMAVCRKIDNRLCLLNDDKSPNMNTGWTILIPEGNQIRIDNVNGNWIKLADALAPGEELVVSQSYHLTAWNDAGEPMITNWARAML